MPDRPCVPLLAVMVLRNKKGSRQFRIVDNLVIVASERRQLVELVKERLKVLVVVCPVCPETRNVVFRLLRRLWEQVDKLCSFKWL